METAPGNAILNCPNCRSALNVNRFVEDHDDRCPVCGSEVSLTVFPRLYREPLTARNLVAGGDDTAARCTFFPDLKAEKVCDECGCLLSEKASVSWGERDFCLPCLHRLREEKKSADFVAQTKLHDSRALALVTLLSPLSLFTAPLALFLLLRHRRDTATFVPRGRVIWWTALLLSVGWIVTWGILIVVWISLILEDLT